jgi:hypothetical protein
MNTAMIVSNMNLEVCELVSQDSVVRFRTQCLQRLVYCFHFNGPVVLGTMSMMVVVDQVSIDRISELVSRTSSSIVELENATDNLDPNHKVSSSQIVETLIVEVCVCVDIYFPVLVSLLIVFIWIFHRYGKFVLVSSLTVTAYRACESGACQSISHEILCRSFDITIGEMVAWVHQDETDLTS